MAELNKEIKNFDVVIVGGGVGGLACGQYSSRAGRKTVIIEEMAPGGQAMIIDEIENYPGLEKLSGYELSAKFEKQAADFGCRFAYATVNGIKKLEDGSFQIDTTDGIYGAPVVVIATGAKHRNLDVPGETEMIGHGVSYCATCDGPFFRDRKILVCGGGDSACQESMYLRKLSDNVTVVHRRDRFRAQASIVKAMEDAGIKTKMNTVVQSINAENGRVRSVTFRSGDTGESYTEDFDGVFIFVGNIPQTQLVPDCEKDASGFIKTDAHMMTSIPGIYAVGDVRDTPFRQIVTVASDGAIAAHYASEYIDARNGRKY